VLRRNAIGGQGGPLRVLGYVDREAFIVEHCRAKRTLDLGVVGETCRDRYARVTAFPSSLHAQLARVASHLVGIDISATEVEAIRSRYGMNVVAADIESMSGVLRDEAPFDFVVAGDIIEHVSNPGKALDEIRRVLAPSGQIIVTTPNAFGAPNYLRFLFGRFHEGREHVHSYTKYTLTNLLARGGFSVTEMWTALDRVPRSAVRRVVYRVGAIGLRLLPDLGGTLVALAERSDEGRRQQTEAPIRHTASKSVT
jgi:2-polyprenyl-3-methyl-5-hydroxy-6-metoxy-1,4-benzoquinol methylase